MERRAGDRDSGYASSTPARRVEIWAGAHRQGAARPAGGEIPVPLCGQADLRVRRLRPAQHPLRVSGRRVGHRAEGVRAHGVRADTAATIVCVSRRNRHRQHIDGPARGNVEPHLPRVAGQGRVQGREGRPCRHEQGLSMCGIAGFFGRGDRDVLERMTSRLVHRGPDDHGFLIEPDSGVHLGFRRLAILDLAGGRQPMTTADGALSIVFNGEIYNFRELRRELTELGVRFQTDHSDTEVLLHGYHRWGEDLPNHLNGMWAFAILDRAHRRAFLSRDRFGKKPLFWQLAGDTLVFASELTAMREHPAVRGGIDERALRKYFAYGYVPAPLSLVEGVHKLPAGHSLTFGLVDRKITVVRYWHYLPEPVDTRPANAESRWVEEFTTLLEAAVKRRLVADVPVGCFLSGGIDSSTVTALAARHAGRDRIKAFSIGFEEASFDETAFARKVAAHVNVDHRVETLPVEHALGILPDLAARMDEPIADSSILPTYLLCQHARREVTVALGGDGADELLAGYDPFRALRYARTYAKLMPLPLHRAVSLLIARLPVS